MEPVATRLLHNIQEFPTLPTVYTMLSEVMSNPRSTSEDAAKIIASDQAAAAKVLKAANSSIYGFSGRIDTISRAIFYIGFNEVQNLIAALSIINMFKDTKPSLNFSLADLWKHSIAVGVLTRIIGEKTGVKNLENYFVAGILHDIGKSLFYVYADKEYGLALRLASAANISVREAELKVIGMPHTVAGELLSERWKLPLSIRNVIRYHPTGIVNDDTSQIVACVHIANIAVRFLELGYPGDDFVPEPNRNVWNKIALPSDFFTNSVDRIRHDYEESIKIMML